MPLVGTGAVELENDNVIAAAVGVHRCSPGGIAFSCNVHIAVVINGNGSPIVVATRSMEGVPQEGPGAVELENDNVIAAAVGGNRCSPGGRVVSCDVHVTVVINGNGSPIVVAIRPVEGMPLVGTGAVELENDNVIAAAVGVDG